MVESTDTHPKIGWPILNDLKSAPETDIVDEQHFVNQD